MEHLQHTSTGLPYIYRDDNQLILDPPPSKRITATGYTSKGVSDYKTMFAGKLYRVYFACFSNTASHYIISRGIKIILM